MVTASHTQPAPAPAADVVNVTAPLTHHFKIPGDKIRLAIADLPPEQKDLVWWFAQHCRKRDFNMTDLGFVLKKPSGHFYSSDSIIQLLTGSRIRRGENIEPILESIANLRRVEGVRENLAQSGFIETRLFREIEKRCLKALHRQRVGFIFGESQIGKSESLKEVQRRHNHGQTIYIEVPTSGSLGGLLQALAKEFSIPLIMNQRMMMDRIIASFDSNMLLILDEAHRFFEGRQGSSGMTSFSFIRELYNKAKCGIVIVLTNEGRDLFQNGPHAKKLLQIWRRRITPLQLPDVPPDDDAALFANAYGLPEATDEVVTIQVGYTDEHGKKKTQSHKESPLALQRAVLKAEGLGVWISILQDAADIAAEQQRDITWGAVIKAYCQSQADSEMLD